MKSIYASSLNPRELDILANADHFVAVRGRGPNRTRVIFATAADTAAYGASFGDKKTMVYAVAGDDTPCCGGVAHITNV